MENMPSLDPWMSRPAIFPDAWISEAYARDTEALTRALRMSLTRSDDNFHGLNMAPPTPAAPNLSTSDIEPTLPRRTAVPGVVAGKVSKRKSRARKRSQTTFITADPANFRQMVQQVTGVKFGSGPQVALMKPEPQRPLTGMAGLGGCLPTLDTSAFLLDHFHQQPKEEAVGAGVFVSSNSSSADRAGLVVGPGPLPGFDFDDFSSFPTLESWKVM